MMNEIRKPVVAGLFYPGDKKKLQEEIELLLSISKYTMHIKRLYGIVVPHAGYIYSGKTAAYAYNLLYDRNIKTVVIISPSHREFFRGSSIYDGEAFETPFGKINVNTELRDKIQKDRTTIIKSQKGHIQEHAIEVQLPFLQSVLGEFDIVPIVMGAQEKPYIDELSEALAANLNDETIIVASSDLSHYYNHNKANLMDSIVEEKIKNFDTENLFNDLMSGKCEACGAGAILTLMQAAKLNNIHKTLILNRTDSGAASGIYNEVVGYLSAVIYD